MISHKGYIGVFRIDPEADVIRGKVIGIKDMITFQGKTVSEAVKAFRESVDDYLDFCQSLGEAPEKPLSGTFLARVGPKVHRELTVIAQAKGMSVNKLVTHELIRVTRRYGVATPSRAKTAAYMIQAPASSKTEARPTASVRSKKTKSKTK